MSRHFDPFEEVMRDAEEKVLRAGVAGGDEHAHVDQATIIMASMSWAVRRIEKSNAQLIKEINGNTDGVKDKLKRHGPAAGIGAGIVALLQFLRDFFQS